MLALKSLKEFYASFESAPLMEVMLRRVAIAFVLNQNHTLTETVKFLTNPSFRQRFYPALAKYRPDILERWKEFDDAPLNTKWEMYRSTINKLERLTITTTLRLIFGQVKSSIDFSKVINEGKILLVNLNGLGRGDADVIGAFIIWEIIKAAELPPAYMARKPFHLFLDEFERFTSQAAPELIQEVRKYGLDTIIAHQYRSQLPDRIAEAVISAPNKIVFRVTGADATDLALEFKREPPKPEKPKERPLVTDPCRFISTHGHEKKEVIDLYRNIQDEVSFFEDYAITIKENRESWWRNSAPYATERQRGFAPDPPSAQIITHNKEVLISKISEYLYDLMRDGPPFTYRVKRNNTRICIVLRDIEDDPESVEVFPHEEIQYYLPPFFLPTDLWEGILTRQACKNLAAINEIYRPYKLKLVRVQVQIKHERNRLWNELAPLRETDYKAWEKKYKELFGDISETTPLSMRLELEHVYELGRQFRKFRETIKTEYYTTDWETAWTFHDWEEGLEELVQKLGLYLYAYPVRSTQGEREEPFERQRPYADVREELANKLANLPPYTAMVKIGIDEYEIHTFDRQSPSKSGIEMVELIKNNSCITYGHDSKQVMTDIEARIRGIPTPDDTISYGPDDYDIPQGYEGIGDEDPDL